MENCKQCKFLESIPSVSLNGFDYPSDWICKKVQQTIRKNIEHFEFDSIEMPEWCPIKDTEEYLWIAENIDQLSEEFEDYWDGIRQSGSSWELNKDEIRKSFFKDKYFEITQNTQIK